MIEPILNIAWLGIAILAFVAVPRSTPRTRVALLCALALLFPIISVTDDLASSAKAFDDAAALAIAIVIAVLLVAIARFHGVTAPAYAIATITPSDPRSPPR